MVDQNVGRLAKWLRVMGYDSSFVPDVDDDELLVIAREQDRSIITKDRYILARRVVTTGQVRAILVTADNFREQLGQLTREMALKSHNVLSLCIECNERLESVSRPQVKKRMPLFVFNSQEQFYQCLNCGKLYWRGTHWHNIRAELAGFTRGA